MSALEIIALASMILLFVLSMWFWRKAEALLDLAMKHEIEADATLDRAVAQLDEARSFYEECKS